MNVGHTHRILFAALVPLAGIAVAQADTGAPSSNGEWRRDFGQNTAEQARERNERRYAERADPNRDLRQELRDDNAAIARERGELRNDYRRLAQDRQDFQRERREGDTAGMRREFEEMRADRAAIRQDSRELHQAYGERHEDRRALQRQDGNQWNSSGFNHRDGYRQDNYRHTDYAYGNNGYGRSHGRGRW